MPQHDVHQSLAMDAGQFVIQLMENHQITDQLQATQRIKRLLQLHRSPRGRALRLGTGATKQEGCHSGNVGPLQLNSAAVGSGLTFPSGVVAC